MYEDLESIVNLKFGEVVERVARENGAKLSAAIADLQRRGLSDSGMMISTRLNSALEQSERACRGLYEIWLELILQRNHGRMSREDVDFIMERVSACTQARTGNIAQALHAPQGPAPGWALQQAQMKMQSVASGIGRELEIKLREQQAFLSELPKDIHSKPHLYYWKICERFGAECYKTWRQELLV